MTTDNEPYLDPLIDEVCQRRRELLVDCGNDLHRLSELVQRRQTQHPEKVVDRRKHNSSAKEVP